METTEILRRFERMTGKFEQAAVEAAVERKDEIIPHLLHMLEDSVERAEELDAEGDYMGHLYSMFLLAQFRETRAYPLVVRFASLPGDLLDSLCGDFICADLGRVLASVYDGNLEGIDSLIENEDIDQWARGAALSSLVSLVAAGQKSRDEVVAYFATLFRGKLVRKLAIVWCELVCYSCDLYPEELLADIEQAYQDDLIDPQFVDIDDVKTSLALGREQVLDGLAANSTFRLVNDTVKEMAWWACFHEERPAPAKRKTGRNEPCPCGSGKKFKKCCGG